jgi:hypothetical protein
MTRSRKDCSLYLAPARSDPSSERGCRPAWRGRSRKNKIGKQQQKKKGGGSSDREKCRSRVSTCDPSSEPLPTLAKLIWERRAAAVAAPLGMLRAGSWDHHPPAGSPSLTVVPPRSARRRDWTRRGVAASVLWASLGPCTCGATAQDSR